MGGRPLLARPDFHASSPERCVEVVRGVGRVQVVDGCSSRRLTGRACRPRMLEATDLAVAEAVVAEGKHAAGECDLGDVAPPALRDPLEGGA